MRRALRAPAWRTALLVLGLAGAITGLAVFARDRSLLPYLLLFAGLCGVLVVVLWRRNDLTTGHVLLLAVLARLALAWLPPSLSDDAYRYVWDGRVQHEDINPYRYVPADSALSSLHDDPVYGLLNSKAYYSVYPPVSQGIFWVGTAPGPETWQRGYYLIKILFILFELAAVWLLARLVAPRWLLLYALSPLVLLETAGQAHTEAAMLFFLVAAVYAARRGHGAVAAAALTLAGWVKLYPLVLLPFLWRRFGWRAVWPAIGVSLLVGLPYAAPYVVPNVLSSLDLYARLFEFNAGLYYAVKGVFQAVTGADWSKQVGPMMRLLFLAGLLLLYVLDARYRWPLSRAMLVTLGLYLVLATTVHPWYLVSLLGLAALLERPAWHWHWLGLCSLGTYALYVGGPYWVFVVLGWVGWLVLAGVRHGAGMLQGLQRFRSRRKVAWIRRFLPRLVHPLEVLDIGAGEGYVGEALHGRTGARVTLADVVGMNRTRLPHLQFDGSRLPFADAAFDATVLYFVLHHAENQEAVLREALRVSRRRVVIVESVFVGNSDLRRLTLLDRWANRLRSGGLMNEQEDHLHFRRASEWRTFIAGCGGTLVAERRRGRWLHRQVLLVVAPATRADTSVIATQKNTNSGETR